MKIDKQAVNEIRKKIKISDVISNFLDIRKKGQNYICVCPFHDDKHPSMSINDEKNIFKCFACGVSGDAFSFIAKYKSINYYAAVLECANILNLDSKYISELKKINETNDKLDVFYKINHFTNLFFKKFIFSNDHIQAIKYLNNRGFNNEDIKKFEIGFAPDNDVIYDLLTNKNNVASGTTNFNYYEIEQLGLVHQIKNEPKFFFKNRITFPIYDENNNVVGFSARSIDNTEPKYLNTNENIIFHKGEVLYNLNQVVKDIDTDKLYIVEGFMDAITIRQCGYDNVVATMGVSFTKKHLELLQSRLPNLKIVILCFDNDDAGINATKSIIKFLQPHYHIYVVDFIDRKYKDIDEIRQNDSALAKNTLNNLISAESFLIKSILNNSKISNEADKLLILNQCIDVMKMSNNKLTILENTKLLSNTLNIDESLILDQINIHVAKKSKSKNYKKYQYNVDVEIDSLNRNKNIKEITIQVLEDTIIQFILNDKYVLDIFEIKRFKTQKNESILNQLIFFYDQNPDKQCVDISDLAKIFDDDETIAKLTSLILSTKKNKQTVSHNAAMQSIETYMKKLREEWNKKQLQKILSKEIDANQAIKEAINKNKNNK